MEKLGLLIFEKKIVPNIVLGPIILSLVPEIISFPKSHDKTHDKVEILRSEKVKTNYTSCG